MTLSFNGKPFDPNTFADTIMNAALQEAGAVVSEHTGISGLVCPVHGESPKIGSVQGIADDMCQIQFAGCCETLEELISEKIQQQASESD